MAVKSSMIYDSANANAKTEASYKYNLGDQAVSLTSNQNTGTKDSYVNGASADKYKFTGKERDLETGYNYLGARLYDSERERNILRTEYKSQKKKRSFGMKFIIEEWKSLLIIKLLCFVLIFFLFGCKNEIKHNNKLRDDLFSINVKCPPFERWAYNIKYECKIKAWGIQQYYYYGYNYSQDTYDFQFYKIDTDSNYIVRVRNFNGYYYKAFYIRWKHGTPFGNTDTLTSNLGYNEMNEAYPNFHGKINIQNINNIKIDTLGFIPNYMAFPIALE